MIFFLWQIDHQIKQNPLVVQTDLEPLPLSHTSHWPLREEGVFDKLDMFHAIGHPYNYHTPWDSQILHTDVH